VLAFHALAIVPLILLEWGGVLPSTFHVANGSLTLSPWIVELTPTATAVIQAQTRTTVAMKTRLPTVILLR